MRVSGLVGTIAALMLGSPRAAQAQTWIGQLLGSRKSPPSGLAATGFVTITLNNQNLSVLLNWTGLTGGSPVAGHLHCCAAPGSNADVAVGYTGFPAFTTGNYSNMFKLVNPAVFSGAFLNGIGGGTAKGAETALINVLNARNAYVNIYNAQFPRPSLPIWLRHLSIESLVYEGDRGGLLVARSFSRAVASS